MIKLEEPDKGRAWVVAAAACIINMILSGISRMVGILYVAVIDEYNVTRSEATLPFTVRNTVRCLSGPILGIIGDRFGIRTITFVGGILASAGAALCCIAPNVFWLTVFWGGMHGLGFSLANTLFQVVVNQYFQKHRASASGVALSGACIGSLGFPVLIEWILDTFGLSGGFLIIGGMVMHVLPPSLLLSAPQWVEHPEAYARLWALQNKTTASVDTLTMSMEEENAEICTDKKEMANRKLSRSMSLSNNPVESMRVSKAFSDHHREKESGIIFDHSGEFSKRRVSVTGVLYNSQKVTVTDSEFHKDHSPSSKATIYGMAETSVSTISGQIQNEIAEHSEDPYSPTKVLSRNKSPPSISQSFRNMGMLYLSPVYILISVCMCTYVFIFIPILTVLVDYANDKGIPNSYGTFLINAMAVGDLVGRLGFGWVTDKKYMTLPMFMFCVLVLQGIFVVLFPVASSITSFATVLVLYSVTAGTLLVIFPVLVLHYIDLSYQSMAIACVGFLSGITSFGIPPMIGRFRDTIGSYDGMFYLTGTISIISGILWLVKPILKKIDCIRRNKNAEDTEQIISDNSEIGSKVINDDNTS